MTETLPQKGDPFILAALEEALFRNRSGTNPNLKRGRMFYDFKAGRVCVPSEVAPA